MFFTRGRCLVGSFVTKTLVCLLRKDGCPALRRVSERLPEGPVQEGEGEPGTHDAAQVGFLC